MENKITLLLLFWSFAVLGVSFAQPPLAQLPTDYPRSKTFSIFQPPQNPITTSLFDNADDTSFTLYKDDMKSKPPIILGTTIPTSIANDPNITKIFQNGQNAKLLAHFDAPCDGASCFQVNISKSVENLCILVGSVDGYDKVTITASNNGTSIQMNNMTQVMGGSMMSNLPPAPEAEVRKTNSSLQLGCFEKPNDNINYKLYQVPSSIDHLKFCYESFDERSEYVYYAFVECTHNTGTPQPNTEEFAISGFSFIDRLGTSKIGLGNPALHNVLVTLLSSSGGEVTDNSGQIVPPKLTDERGYYYFDNLRRNIYTVKFESTESSTFSTVQSKNQSEPLTNKANQNGVSIPLRVTATILAGSQLNEDEKTYISNGSTGILRNINAGFVLSTDGIIDGFVFVDYNANGVMNTNTSKMQAIDVPVKNNDVYLLSSNGSLVATAKTNVDGYYKFPHLPYAEEFTVSTKLPTGYVYTDPPIAPQPNNIIIVSAIKTLNPTGSVNFGIVAPDEVCKNNPSIALVCFSMDQYNGSNANDPVVISFPLQSKPHLYNDTSNNVTHLATYGQVGSVYGLAYDLNNGNLFASAYTKYKTTFGPCGTGAIYRISTQGQNPVSCYFDINKATGNPTYAGVDPHPTGDPNQDNSPNSIGKVSYGDMDYYDGHIYTVLTSTKELLKLSTTDNTSYSLSPILNPCIDHPSDWRPFGVGINNQGKVFVGGVCSMESTPEEVPVAYIVSDTVLSTLKLDYPIGCKRFGNGLCDPGDWRAWGDVFIYTQPMVSDVSFDGDDVMLMSLRDRGGDQNTDLGIYDMHIACLNSTTLAFDWENVGVCGDKVGAHPYPAGYFGREDGLGGGEFFDDNFFFPPDQTGHDNLAATATFYLPGYHYVFGTSVDIDTVGQGVFKWWDKTTGKVAGGLGIYKLGNDNSDSVFGKSNGLGDTEPFCPKLTSKSDIDALVF